MRYDNSFRAKLSTIVILGSSYTSTFNSILFTLPENI